MNWKEMLIAAISAGGLTQLLNYVRNTRKDSTKARVADAKRSDELTMQMWLEITKEQRDWRETMRREIDRLQDKLAKVQEENAQLLRRIAELEAHNTDLKLDNDELKVDNDKLEARVKELERRVETPRENVA